MPGILYLLDLDGTLLNTSAKLSAISRDILNNLMKCGVSISFATARSLSSALRVLDGLQPSIPMITYNGAFLVDPITGKISCKHTFAALESQYVRNVFTDAGIYPLVYALVGGQERVSWMSGTENDGILHYLETRAGDPRLRCIRSIDALYDGDIFYFSAIGEYMPLLSLRPSFHDSLSFTTVFQQELYRPGEYWLEVFSADANKGSGLRMLKELIACDKVICFGDSLNDLPMFKEADYSYAVENALSEVKQAATGVIGSNDTDSVALWLSANSIR